MRRVSVHRPKEKVRGIERRLKAIDAWADSFEGYFPSEYKKNSYWNYKIPTLDRLVNPPTTSIDIQKHCVLAMFQAMEHLAIAKPDECSDAIITTLIQYPKMFHSELCIFFDKEYYDFFYTRNNTDQSLTPIVENVRLSDKLNIRVPKIFNEKGYIHNYTDDWEGNWKQYSEEWWSYSDHKG